MDIKQKIYLDLEPHFVYDYIFFSAHLRFLKAHENSYKKYSNDQKARAMCLVNLFETYQQSLEDLGAMILAFHRRYNSVKECSYQKEFNTNETPLIYSMIHYRPGDAILKDLISLFPTNTGIINGFGINNVEKINITLVLPDINFKKFYNFFLVGLKSLSDDQFKRLRMFNKIKHGGVVVGDGHVFSNTLKQSPATIYSDPKAFDPDDHPLVIHGLKYVDEEFELMEAGVMKIATMIKIMLSIYLCKEYRNLVMNNGYKISIDLFKKIQAKRFLNSWNGY